MSGPNTRRRKIIIIIIVTGRLVLNNESDLYNSALNLSASLLPTADDLSGSYAADTGNAIDTFAAIVGDNPDDPDSFTQTEIENYVDALNNYLVGI